MWLNQIKLLIRKWKCIPNRPDLQLEEYAKKLGWTIEKDLADEISEDGIVHYPLTFIRGEETIGAVIRDGIIQWSYNEDYDSIGDFLADIRTDLKELFDTYKEPSSKY